MIASYEKILDDIYIFNITRLKGFGKLSNEKQRKHKLYVLCSHRHIGAYIRQERISM